MSHNYLITGGAGFIGCNYVERLIRRGENVTIFDNLSRKGTSKNLEWLRSTFGEGKFDFIHGDVRDASALESAVDGKDVIVHLAGQVAVTSSISQPRFDFEVNALGTLNVLEAARRSNNPPFVIYASTNKVYGEMENIKISETKDAYIYTNQPMGIPETQPLDFHSPYGCSKGAGDQYVRDYYRTYQLPTVVMRQSCIYGPHQLGIEDQGWVAWFVIAAVLGKPITIYGDGKQVRDVLFVEDLLDAYDAAIAHRETAAGEIFNIGGGPTNTMSIWAEFGQYLQELLGQEVPVQYSNWRVGDQRLYISDIRKAQKELEWTPTYDIQHGLQCLYDWVMQNKALFK